MRTKRNSIGLAKAMLVAFSLAGLHAIAFAEGTGNKAEKEHVLTAVEVKADALDPDDARPKDVSTATKIPLPIKDIPQTIESVEVSKYKVYGTNDLSVMLNGYAGVDTTYDMRGDGIIIRGFEASSGDIYRDGIRSSGQVRRSTANIERIEVLKGPASVLYGRGSGGGVVNMISKIANFEQPSNVAVRGGDWSNAGGTVDINRVLNEFVVIRLTADYEQAHSFREGIKNRNSMVSPSIAIDTHRGLKWLGQYSYDKVWRRPDRPPSYDSLPDDVPKEIAYAHYQDFVEDRLDTWRSVLSYDFNEKWSLKWTSAQYNSSQDFDHLYNGSYCQPNGKLKSNGKACSKPGQMTFTRSWQETDNETLTNMLDLIGNFSAWGMKHELLVGLEYSVEKRHPKLATSTSDPALTYPWGVNPYDPQWVAPKTPRNAATTENRHEARSEAIYVQDLVSITPQWKVLAGARYDYYDFSSDNVIKGEKRSYNGNSVSPRVGLIWQPVTEHSFYVSYSKNFSPYGGRGLLGVATNESAVFDDEPQYSKQYEVGLKSDWLDGALSSQIALYNLELYNERYQPDPIADPYNWAIRGKERSRGVELSVTGRINPRWYVRSSLGYQEAKVIEDKASPQIEGKLKENTARESGNIYVRYVPHDQWYAEIGTVLRGRIYNDAANTSQRAGYALWNASIGYRPAPWVFTLAVSNLTDKEYWRSSSMPGTPRTFLASASYLF